MSWMTHTYYTGTIRKLLYKISEAMKIDQQNNL